MEKYRDELATHPSLLLRIREAGDRLAWSEFSSIYRPMIIGYCRLKGLQESDAADVAQEVMLRVTKAIRQFEYDPSKGRFRDWLGKVLYNELIRFWKRQKMQPKITAEAMEADQQKEDTAWISYFQSELLKKSLDNIECEFPSDQWRAFQMTWINDKPASEVAVCLNIGIDTVYVAKSRILKRLRAEVNRLTEDLPVSK